MPKDFRGFYLKTGDIAGSLDNIAIATFEDLDGSFVMTDGTAYLYSFDSSATNAESDPMYIRPEDYGAGPGVHVLQSLGCNNLTVEGGIENGLVINNAGDDFDFNVESVTEANALFVQGSDGFVGIGTGTPDAAMHIVADPNLSNGLVKIQVADGSPNDSCGYTMWAKATGASTNARNWSLMCNYNNYGSLEFMVSSSSSGNPNSTVLNMSRSGNVGIGTTAPVCDLDVNGGIATATTAKTAAYTATVNDHLITAKNTSGSSYDISLPAAATAEGLELIIKSENDSVDNIGVNPNGSELVDNSSTSLVLTPGDAVTVKCDGTEWWVI